MKVRVHISGPQQTGGSLKGSFTVSLILHGLLFGSVLFGGLLVSTNSAKNVWGEEGLGGGHAVPINMVPTVPLPETTGPKNPLASPTTEVNPAEVKRTPPPEPAKPSPNELQIKKKQANEALAKLQEKELENELKNLRRQRAIPENAIPGTTDSGRASSQIYGMSTAQGSGGMGFSGDFGSLYGLYVRQVRDCISRHWDQSRIDTAVRAAPKVFVEFDIERDGTFRKERIATPSNVPTVDREALRSVQACSGRRDVGADAHLPPLPSDYRGASVHVEVWFEFKK